MEVTCLGVDDRTAFPLEEGGGRRREKGLVMVVLRE